MKQIINIITLLIGLGITLIFINTVVAQDIEKTVNIKTTQVDQDVFKSRHDELTALLNWAAYLSGYQTNGIDPELKFEPHQFFVDSACQHNQKCKVIGWYNDQGVVYIDDRLVSLEHIFERSLVVHEFVHYLQHMSGKFHAGSCESFVQREREAYSAQRDFIIAYGVSPSVTFHQHSCATGLS